MIASFPESDIASIPPLRNGDRLSIAEFERRWQATPSVKKAELIEGRVYLSESTGHWTFHAEPRGRLAYLLSSYAVGLAAVSVGVGPSIRMGSASMPQADAVMRIDERIGGRSRIDDGLLVGGPEFIGEVCGTDEGHNWNEKKSLYERSGVQEYLIWSQHQKRIGLFKLESDSYHEIHTQRDGILKSSIFPGLWFDPAALIADDRERIKSIAQAGVKSAEFRSFVENLNHRVRAIAGRS